MKLRRITWERIACLVTAAGLCQFIASAAVAMYLYPGGDSDPNTEGYSFWRNSLSELGGSVSALGEPNPFGSVFFNTSMSVAAATLVGMWLAAPSLFARRKTAGLLVRIGGPVSMAGMIAVMLLPTDTHHYGHMTAIGFMAIAGLPALGLCCYGVIRHARPGRVYIAVTFVLLVVAVVHFVQFASHFYFGGPWTPAAPLIQKLVALAAIAWIALTSAKVWQAAR